MRVSAVNVGLSEVLWVCLLGLVVHVSCQRDVDFLTLPQCVSNDECDELRTCIDLKCQDSCPGICYGNSTCRVHNHVPYCACKPGFSGDPFTGCQKASPGNCSLTGNKVYKVERFIKVNWFAALIHCQTHGGRLATINSKEENDLIKEEISKTRLRNDRFWISGTNYPSEQWIWMVSGTPLPDFTDWEPGEPNNWEGTEHCLEFYEKNKNGYMWNDRKCEDQVYCICEYFE